MKTELEQSRKKGHIFYCTAKSIGVMMIDYKEIVKIEHGTNFTPVGEFNSECETTGKIYLKDGNEVSIILRKSEVEKYKESLNVTN